MGEGWDNYGYDWTVYIIFPLIKKYLKSWLKSLEFPVIEEILTKRKHGKIERIQ